jgi:subtilisin family serine protease
MIMHRIGTAWRIRRAFTLLLITFALTGCSTYSPTPRPYKETFSAPLSSMDVDRSEMDERFSYQPGFVTPTAADKIVKSPTGALLAQDEYVLVLRTNARPADLLADLRNAKISASLVGFVPSFRFVQLLLLEKRDSTELLEKLNRLPSVEAAYPHFIRRSQAQAADWHIRNFGIEKVWSAYDGTGVRIAILDTGLDTTLAAFRDRIVHPYSVITRSPRFEDGQLKRGGDVLRVIDHGTRVASIAGAAGASNTVLVGVAPGTEIMPIQVIGFHVAEEEVYTNDLTILEGLARAIAFRAEIVNVSLGTDYARALRENTAPEKREQIMREIRRESNAVRGLYDVPFKKAQELNVWVVVAAGNSADSADNEPIASHPYVISVGALDSQDRRASFSNFGQAVSTYAPGVGVVTLIPGGTLVASSGTSFSAPYVSGMLALLRAGNPAMTFREAKERLRDSNISSRTTILAGQAETPVFDPISLLGDMSMNPRRNLRRFYTLYHDLFISNADTGSVKLTKILAFYRRARVYSSQDPEAIAAFPLVAQNFAVIESRVKAGLELPEASLLADAPLKPEQMRFLRNNIARSDYIAVIVRGKSDRESIPLLWARLQKKDFNANTLCTLWNFNEPGTHERIASYLRMRQTDAKWAEDEAFAMMGLAMTKDRLDDDAQRLLSKSLGRFNQRFFSMANAGLVDMDADPVVEALILAGNRDGLVLALDALDQIHRRLAILNEDPERYGDWEEIGLGNSREELGQRLERLQRTFNEATTFPLKYNHQAPSGERERVRAQLLQYVKNAAFSGRKFHAR